MIEKFANKKVLITGGLGFIGSNLARRLVKLGANVTLVDKLIPEHGGNLFNIAGIEKSIVVSISDVRAEDQMRDLVQGQDYLFNLAGQTSHLDSMIDPCTDLEMNCRSHLVILEACRKYSPQIRIVFASTRQVYGKPEYLPVDEKHIARPVDINGINKLAAEFYHKLYCDIYGVFCCTIRLTNTIGPRMRVKDARQTFLGIWIRRLLQGQPFEVWGGGQLRDFTYVEDAIDALLMAAVADSSNGKIFNLGGDRPISLKHLADLLIQVNEGGAYSVLPYPSDRKPIEIGDYYSDFGLIGSELGWQPRVLLEEGLARTLSYYRQHGDKYWKSDTDRRCAIAR